MAKFHLVANTFQIKELFKVVATYAVSGMSLELKVSVLFIGLCAREIIKNVKTSSVDIAYYTIQYLSPRRCTLLITWSV